MDKGGFGDRSELREKIIQSATVHTRHASKQKIRLQCVIVISEHIRFDTSPWQFQSYVQMGNSSLAQIGTLHLIEQSEIETDTMEAYARMGCHLDDQRNILGSAASTIDCGTYGNRVFDSLSGFHSVSRGSR